MEGKTPPLHVVEKEKDACSGEKKRMAMAIPFPLLRKVRPDGHGQLVEANGYMPI